MSHSNLYMKARRLLSRTPFTSSLVSRNSSGIDSFRNTRLQKGKALPSSRAHPQTTDRSSKVSTTLPSVSTLRTTSAGSHGLNCSILTTRQVKNALTTGLVSPSFRPNVRGSEEEDPSHPRAGETTTMVVFPTSSPNGHPFRPLQLSAQVTTDASPTGWGAHSNGHTVHVLWSHRQRGLHINHLEMLAMIKSFRAFLPLIQGCGVQVVTDNTTTLYYINKQGGTRSLSLLYLAVHLWEWCCHHHIYPVAIHISTSENQLADELSRWKGQSHEWELDNVFQMLCSRWDRPAIDVFTSHRNKKCKRYASQAGRGPGFLGDAFMMPWHHHLLYLFPPIPLIQRSLVRIRQQRSSAILIASFWPRQPWFSTLKELATKVFRFPPLPHLLTQDLGSILYPDVNSLHLAAWKICLKSRRC
ncbi:uncharacterized protein LOC140704859 [Pogona vitticeps]